jgi:glucokinase-like ROK family protein
VIKQTTRDIRRTNRLAVLQHIYALAPVSRQQITDSSALSQATVANVVTDLIDMGLVRESGYVDSQGGRPRAMLSINSTSGFVIGIDIAETYIHFELFDLALQLKHAIEHMLHPQENQPQQVVTYLVQGIEQLIHEAQLDTAQILGIGISVPGLVEREGGVSAFAPNWGWRNVPLLAMLEQHISLPLYLDNPLKASAIAELWFGTGRWAKNLITLNIGTGVGAGIIINGALYRGATSSAGEWGHTSLVLDGRPCRCGSFGCVEAYIGAPGIIRTLRELAPQSPLLHDDDQTATITALAAAAGQGDAVALEVIRQTAKYMGAATANLINLFNPEVIVIGSWVGRRLGPYLLPEIQKEVARLALPQPLNAVTIQLCQLQQNRVSKGAATFALEGYLARVDTPRTVSR